jgi:acetyl-CoA carboxylase biotin carboxyl carrier protein
VSKRRSSKSSPKGRAIVLPNPFAGSQPASDALVTGSQTKQIQELIDLLRRNNLTELELERHGVRIRVRHEAGAKSVATAVQEPATAAAQQTVQPAVATGPSPEEAAGMVTVTSPIVGTFYRSPSPDADPYVEEGDLVKKGQVLCIVEAMKLMNEIESETDGRIVKILAESTKPVEYGQALFLIDPKATA